jgi:penicillin-binding protein 1B
VTVSHSRTYSATRLRVVLLLLTLATLPVVLGASVFIYYYVRYSVMVERRLNAAPGMIPSRLYTRPAVLRPGLPMDAEALLTLLNDLRYEQRDKEVVSPGQFAAVDHNAVLFFPRPSTDAAKEPVAVIFDKGKIRDLRGQRSKSLYQTQTLEPELITYLFDDSREKQRLVRYEDVPMHLIHAVLAIEDRRFFSHPGLDPFRILGALIRNLRTDSEVLHGGSTITQQLVKNFFLTPERTMRRKIQEAVIAFVLERRATKRQILELYLNEIYLGQEGSFGVKGIGQASRVYFHKDVANLTLAESAYIAGIIHKPNQYNPYRHAKPAVERRDHVIRMMVEAGFIDQATADAAIAEPFRVEAPILDTAEAPYFVDLVKTQLEERYDSKDLPRSNLSIYTTLDLRLQAYAQKALRNGLEAIDAIVEKRKKKPAQQVQGCLIALEPSTGNVVALVGGRSYGASQYNRVIQARRQPGSTFKPFVYLAAFENTFDRPDQPPITPAMIVNDTETVFFYESKEYIPENYEGKYLGDVTLRKALASSLNVATVKVAEMVGYRAIADLWSNKLGMPSKIEPYPAVALGSFEATPFEMATAYNVLANNGMKVRPQTVVNVVNEKGENDGDYRPKPPTAGVHMESAVLVTHMLRSVLNEGTAASARTMGFTADAAGKTGTTNDMRDAWFAGYTPDLLCVVWVGFDDNTPINLSGAKAALPIWTAFMKDALAGIKPTPFAVPATGVVFIDIDKDNGLLATPHCPRVISEAFIAGTEPNERCTEH